MSPPGTKRSERVSNLTGGCIGAIVVIVLPLLTLALCMYLPN